MQNGRKKAAPGKSGNLKSQSATNHSLADLDSFMSPVDAEKLPEPERLAYHHGFAAGVRVTTDSAYAAGYTEGHRNGLQASSDSQYRKGWNDALQAHWDAIDSAAREAVRPHVAAIPYWELCLIRGNPDEARNALRRALQTGLAGPGDKRRFGELTGHNFGDMGQSAHNDIAEIGNTQSAKLADSSNFGRSGNPAVVAGVQS